MNLNFELARFKYAFKTYLYFDAAHTEESDHTAWMRRLRAYLSTFKRGTALLFLMHE